MNEPGSFKKDFNWSGWAVACAIAAGSAEIFVKFLFPLIIKAI